MFCYNCGKESKLIRGLCPQCYSKLNSLLKLEPKYNITICSNCDTFLLVEWRPFETIEDIIESILIKEAGKQDIVFTDAFVEQNFDKIQVKYNFKMHEEYIEVDLTAYCSFNESINVHIEEDHRFLLYPKYTVCPPCSKKYGGYYEAVFQIRREGRFLSENETRSFIEEVLENSNNELEKNNMAFITQVLKKKEGVDFQMGSLKFTKKLARALQRKYGGSISESYRLTGYNRQEGKNRYRTTVVLRLSKFEKGVYVLYGDSLWKVDNAVEKILMNNFDKNFALDFKKAEKEVSSENLSIIDQKDLAKGMIVSINEGFSQIMSLENYKTFDVETLRIPLGAKQGDQILFLKKDENYYLVNP